MKHFFLFVLVTICSSALCQAQQGSSKATVSYDEKMEQWLKYANQVSGSDSGIKEQPSEAVAAGLKGIAMARPQDKKRIAHFSLIAGGGYYNQLKFDSAFFYFEKAFQESQQIRESVLIASAAGILITMHFQMQQPEKADSLKIVLESLLDTASPPLSLAKANAGLGNYYYLKSYYSTAQSYFLNGLAINEKIADTSADYRFRKDFAIQNYMLYKIYMNSELYDKAKAALARGSRHMNSSPALKTRYYSAFIDAYVSQKNPNVDSAMMYYKLLQDQPRQGAQIPSELVTSNIILAQYYMNQKNWVAADEFIKKAEAFSNASQSPFLIHQAQNIKGIYLFNTGNYDQAIELLLKSTEISRQINKGNYVESLHYISRAYEAKGDTENALKYLILSTNAKDSLTRENMTREFADLEIQYRTKEKEQEIKALNAAGKLSDVELQAANRLKTVLIVGILVLALILVLLYRFYRNKEKLNQVLNDRNRELDKLNNSLALANESKARLFGILSHDLRSPVSKIAQFLRLQKDNPSLFSEHTKNAYHEKFSQTTENLLSTMEDLLIWSKSQMEQFNPELRKVNIREIAIKEIALFTQQIEEHNLKLQLNISETLGITTDENFVAIILRNFLQNASRYSMPGSTIEINANTEYLAIINTSGDAVNASDLNEQLNKDTLNSKSFGLGLQIARDLAGRIGIRLGFKQHADNRVAAMLFWNRSAN